MTAQIVDLIDKQDNVEIVRAKLASILLEESAEQQVLAATIAVDYTRADDSDYTATAAADVPGSLQFGDYVITAGTLVAGVGTWTAEAPDGTTEQETTVAADDDLLFPTLGITVTVTAVSEPFDTGDVITCENFNPALWKLRVYIERSNPIADWSNSPETGTDDAAPRINISFNTESFIEAKSDPIKRQLASAQFWIDCYGYGVSTEMDAGHTPGDLMASDEAFRAVRLVRNILMASFYAHLGLRSTVWSRFPESIERFQPQLGEQDVQNVVANRLTMRVDFNEFSPQVTGETLEEIWLTMKREEDGEVLLIVQTDIP